MVQRYCTRPTETVFCRIVVNAACIPVARVLTLP
jgi:hypothetical protein